MSYSDPQITNPVEKYISFSGSKGEFSFWDSEKGEKGENVVLDFPLTFIPLDETHTLGGFNDEYNVGIYANQIRDTKTQKLVARAKRTILQEGLYDEIKGKDGIKYAKNVYCLSITPDGKSEIVCLKVMGSFLSAFIEAKIKIGQSCFMIKGEMIDAQKGNTDYKIPVIEKYKVTEKWHEPAIEADKALKPYLTEATKTSEPEPREAPEVAPEPNRTSDISSTGVNVSDGNWEEMEDPSDDLPF